MRLLLKRHVDHGRSAVAAYRRVLLGTLLRRRPHTDTGRAVLLETDGMASRYELNQVTNT